jgi:predicted cobalt transporter CbtA
MMMRSLRGAKIGADQWDGKIEQRRELSENEKNHKKKCSIGWFVLLASSRHGFIDMSTQLEQGVIWGLMNKCIFLYQLRISQQPRLPKSAQGQWDSKVFASVSECQSE